MCVRVCVHVRARAYIFMYKHTPPITYVQSVYTYKQIENDQPVR